MGRFISPIFGMGLGIGSPNTLGLGFFGPNPISPSENWVGSG